MDTIVARHTVVVGEGEYAPLPESNKLVLGHPGSVEVQRWQSGKLSFQILSGKTVPIELALIKKWKRLSWEI